MVVLVYERGGVGFIWYRINLSPWDQMYFDLLVVDPVSIIVFQCNENQQKHTFLNYNENEKCL